MKEKLITWMKGSKYSMHLLRALVGGYVVYLGAQVIYDIIKGEAQGFGLILCACLIVLAGGAIVGVSLWAVLGGHCADYGGNHPVDADEEAEESDDTQSDIK